MEVLKNLLTAEELAIELNVSCSFVRKLISRRQIPFLRLGNKMIRFSRKQVEEWIQQENINLTDFVIKEGVVHDSK